MERGVHLGIGESTVEALRGVDGVPEGKLAGVRARQRATRVAQVPHLEPPRGAAAPSLHVLQPVRRGVPERVADGAVHVAVDDPRAAELAIEPVDHRSEAGVEVLRHGVVLLGARAAQGALHREAAHGRHPV